MLIEQVHLHCSRLPRIFAALSLMALMYCKSQARQWRRLRLSAKETQVIQFLAKGIITRQIAEALYAAVNTVESHRAHIMRKLGAVNTADMVMKATPLGLLPSSWTEVSRNCPGPSDIRPVVVVWQQDTPENHGFPRFHYCFIIP